MHFKRTPLGIVWAADWQGRSADTGAQWEVKCSCKTENRDAKLRTGYEEDPYCTGRHARKEQLIRSGERKERELVYENASF